MDKSSSLELFRGTLDLLILKSLTWGPLHGYAITNSIRSQTDEVLLVEEGTLYPALHRMEAKGWIEAEWGLSENKCGPSTTRWHRKGAGICEPKCGTGKLCRGGRQHSGSNAPTAWEES